MFPLFGLPFIAAGLWMLWMPIAAQRAAAWTVYGLTNRRLLSISAGTKHTRESVMLFQMGPIDVSADADGHDTLRIQTGTSIDSDGDHTTERFEVAGVPDVARLGRLLLEQRARVQQTPSTTI